MMAHPIVYGSAGSTYVSSDAERVVAAAAEIVTDDSAVEETGFEPSVPPARVSSVVAPCLFEATR
jgi:hypothetical protein